MEQFLCQRLWVVTEAASRSGIKQLGTVEGRNMWSVGFWGISVANAVELGLRVSVHSRAMYHVIIV